MVKVYEAFQNGVPLELSIAELGAAKAEAEARRQAEAMARQPSNLQQSVPPPATVSRPISIDWAGLIRRYQQHKLRSGEIKETTWEPSRWISNIRHISADLDLRNLWTNGV